MFTQITRLSTIAICALVGSSSVLYASNGPDNSTESPKPYAKVIESDSSEVQLQMCERVFTSADGNGPRIRLVSAIHIADASFYKEMQNRLDSYDTVLFEGVKPAGLDPIDSELDDQSKADATQDRINLLFEIIEHYHAATHQLPSSFDDLLDSDDSRIAAMVGSTMQDGWGSEFIIELIHLDLNDEQSKQVDITSTGSDRKIGGQGLATDIKLSSRSYTENEKRKPTPEGIQSQLANALRVSFQLDEMDTSRKNWINADIDINELQKQLSAQGEDNAQILKLIEGDSFQAKIIGFALKFVSRSPTMSSMMKLAMMDMLALVESSNMLEQFDAVNNVILLGRNDIVIDYLKAELAKNKNVEDIAIFYGAAHMPGLEEVITSQLGYQFDSDIWTTAMTVDIEETGLSKTQIKMMRNMIKSSLEQQF
ncbi:MAG: type II secretion system protein GspG [Phycisphaerales bacterium]|nr:type II secretion system protein GspG [Phycisphaerales bacterium]